MKKLIFLLILLFLPVFASAATLHGTVYDLDFDIVENVIIEIDSQPKQSVIANDGSYSFELNPGSYVLEAKYFIEQTLISSASEEVNIVEEGDYILDLILFPVLDDDLNGDFEFDINGDSNNYLYWIVGILIIFIILWVLFRKKPKKKDFDLNESDDVLGFIKKEGGRTTQKEIRKNFGLSEAKTSLIITELEHKKIIRRIKKGRGNIIILSK